MFLVGLLQVNMGGGGVPETLKKRVDALGMWGALLLGVAFALAFCPTSAALFFGSVVASLRAGSSITLPLLYGVGTALPVIGFAILLAFGSNRLGTAFNAVGKLERWARLTTGSVILFVGLWLTVRAIAW
jgi:cytochrome c biogenesis protein CcdA